MNIYECIRSYLGDSQFWMGVDHMDNYLDSRSRDSAFSIGDHDWWYEERLDAWATYNGMAV